MTTLSDPRVEAFWFIQSVTDGSVDHKGQGGAPKEFTALDQALFHEVTHGVFREFRFLDFVINERSRKKPRLKARNLLLLAAYQILFLERVPSYAVFAELKKMATQLKFSEEEGKFLHGVLKTIERDRQRLLQAHALALKEMSEGRYPSEPLGACVLNLPEVVVDSLKKAVLRDGHKSALLWKSLHRLKERPLLIGYVWPGSRDAQNQHLSLQSQIAPRAIVFKDGQTMRAAVSQDRVRIQGETSQWACEVTADLLRQKQNPSVLEMASGKGGKLFGTIAALKNSGVVQPMTWVASDHSVRQMEILESGPLDHLRSWGIQIETLVWDWTRTELPELDRVEFDFIWLDAPCSGLGTLAKHPEIAYRVSAETLDSLGDLQLKLLLRGWPLVKKGGNLFYTLCTVSYEETWGVLEKFTSQCSDAKVTLKRFLWPGDGNLKTAEGFFGVILHKE